jgi:hypothetical protein
MTWEYLNTPALQGRLYLIAGYLGPKIADKRIFDLNCGVAPLLSWLPRTWTSYTGNDLDLQPLAALPKTAAYNDATFLLCSDDVVPEQPGIDVLLVLGYACGFSGQESCTLDQSVLGLAGHYEPEYIILEAWRDLPPRCRLAVLTSNLLRMGYQTDGRWQISGGSLSPYQDRQVIFLHLRSDHD